MMTKSGIRWKIQATCDMYHMCMNTLVGMVSPPNVIASATAHAYLKEFIVLPVQGAEKLMCTEKWLTCNMCPAALKGHRKCSDKTLPNPYVSRHVVCAAHTAPYLGVRIKQAVRLVGEDLCEACIRTEHMNTLS